ncbi:MAG TPA: hypothetical protein PLT76_01600 [Candidatus Omnitrophota bacterium]|nr:hypothetical protein [Candidatus Omnitrophota bacterium]HPB67689.1 hypothetical protein [Candidatus Omnitrophota bacterium]HQO57402.1 hypothetical protein [Candidatus Omnitrophota bacterium]HQP12713.1 hypothetical protein [Candidatus Omnitrophota bacterium]
MEFGIRLFCTIYNILGLLGLSACVSSAAALSRSRNLVIGEADLMQIVAYIVAVLFFFSAFLLMKRKTPGFLLPIFLLAFFVSGGFVVLLPLLAGHILFFTRPRIKAQFH